MRDEGPLAGGASVKPTLGRALADVARRGADGRAIRPAAPGTDANPVNDVNDRSSAQSTDDAALRAIVQGVEAETGSRFFASLVRHLASALGVAYAFVSELSLDRKRFRTLAVWGRGRALDDFEVPVEGTPCEAVLSGEMSHHPERLCQLFPEDVGLVDWGAESYCGVPLLAPDGVVIGHLAIFDDKPMRDGPRGIAIMRIFAARARAEIERMRTASALADSEANFRDLYEEAPIAYLSVGTDGVVRQANRAAVELFGYPREQLLGKRVFDLGADTEFGKPRQRAAFERFRAGVATSDEEIELRTSDGAAIWVRLFVRPMRDAAGNVVATRSTLFDCTARKQAEEALRESEERLSRILDSAMDAIVTFDEQRRVELFNDAAERTFGTSAESAIGGRLDRFLGEFFLTALETAMVAARSGRERPYVWAPGPLSACRADGSAFHAESTLSHVDVGGRRFFTLILRDVDERRRSEEELRKINLQNAYLQEEIKAAHNVDEIVGQSAALANVLEQVRLVATTDSSVLILGETGTGKELIARAVHLGSARRGRPLIKVNCAALPTGLIESELFGHEKGAFTGATERRIGRFELAHGGTIFLDEIGEIPLETQVKLLRVLQEREFERLGGRQTHRVDVRVIAATNRDLPKAIAAGTFRQDLYYRLNVFPVRVPALRERIDDIPLLVHYFARRYAGKVGRVVSRVPRETMQRLMTYPWPGNIRELENVIERAVILSSGAELEVAGELLPTVSASAGPRQQVEPLTSGDSGSAAAEVARSSPLPGKDESPSLVDVERRHIREALRETGWRIDGPNGAARILGLNPSTLRSRMQKLGIRRSTDSA
jgi:formate hydrogenlyase transcriptional activator